MHDTVRDASQGESPFRAGDKLINASCIALIPARAGSKRLPGKNLRRLAGRPLVEWAIRSAQESGVFDAIVVSSDSQEALEIAEECGAEPLRRPAELAGDTSPDIEWVRHALSAAGAIHESPLRDASFDPAQDRCFAILRPTSPFRTAETIRRAWGEWLRLNGCDASREPGAGAIHELPPRRGRPLDSMRAVERVAQHPGKMWTVGDGRLRPLLLQPAGQPWHSSQYASLPEVWVQNASLEIAWVSTVTELGSIAGERIAPFFTRGCEGFDVNTELDFRLAELLAAEGAVALDLTESETPVAA